MTTEHETKVADEKIIDLDPDQVIDVDAAKPNSSPPKAKGRSSALPLLGLGAALLGAVGGGWLYRDVLSSYLPSDEMARINAKAEALETGNTALRDQLAKLDTLSQQFKSDIDALESSQTAAGNDVKAAIDSTRSTSTRIDQFDTALNDIKATQSALQDAISKLQSAPPAKGEATTVPPVDLSVITQRLDALEKDVASLKSGTGAGGVNSADLSQALSDLKAKFSAGVPFADELARIKRMAPAAPGLDDLERYATTGVGDVQALTAELKSIAVTLKPTADVTADAAKDDSWTGWATDLLSDIVSIRDAGDADWAKTAEAAAAFSESGDLQQAISQITETEGAKPPAVQQWLEKAQARVTLEGTLAGVEAAVLRVLANNG